MPWFQNYPCGVEATSTPTAPFPRACFRTTLVGLKHELKPAAGETVTFESAERPRYVVQYELAATWAFAVNQSLTSGDSITIGLYDGSNGWYMEHDGSHSDTQADFVLERDGTEVYRRKDLDIFETVLNNARLKLTTGWYDITRQEWERSFPDDTGQNNKHILTTSAPDSRGSKTGNLPIHFEVTADANTSDLILEAGSAAQVNLGNTTPLLRTKQQTVTQNVDATDTYVPIFALRVDPDRNIINSQLVDVAIGEFAGNADIELSVHAFDPSNVLDTDGNELTDSDFSTPAEFMRQNNAVEVSGAVEQVADSSGTTQTSMADPGGFQIGYDLLTTASGNDVTSEVNTSVLAKRPLYDRDIAVVLANAGATGDVTFLLRHEQDW